MFQVSATGQSIMSATGPQSLLNDAMPLTKLDTTNIISFQKISILFNHEPVQPDPVSYTAQTLLYQFKHGYTYIPSVWMDWQNPSPAYPSPPTTSGGSATTFNAFGDESAASNLPNVGTTTANSLFAVVSYNDPSYGVANYTMAFLYCIADATNVSIYMQKTAYQTTSSNTIVPLYVVGETVYIRCYVSTEPATISNY